MTIAVCKNSCGNIYLLGDNSPQYIRMKHNLFSCHKCKKKQFNIFENITYNALDDVIGSLTDTSPKHLDVIAYLDK